MYEDSRGRRDFVGWFSPFVFEFAPHLQLSRKYTAHTQIHSNTLRLLTNPSFPLTSFLFNFTIHRREGCVLEVKSKSHLRTSVHIAVTWKIFSISWEKSIGIEKKESERKRMWRERNGFRNFQSFAFEIFIKIVRWSARNIKKI